MNFPHLHQKITRMIGGRVEMVRFRDHDGELTHSVSYTAGATRWLSRYRFDDENQAAAAADVLRDFLRGDEEERA